MSYILDALKQNEQSSGAMQGQNTMHEQYYETQKQLQKYRKISLVLLLIIISMAGFFVGKYVQKSEQQIVEAQPVQKGTVLVENEQATNSATTEVVVPQNQNQVVVAQPTASPAANPVSQPIESIQAKTQQAVKNNPTPANNINVVGDKLSAENDDVDLSQYRVVGEPLQIQPKEQQFQPTSELEMAFSEAFNEVDQQNTNEVVSASKLSAEVTPINLLPSSIQSQIPPMIYQAHIHASISERSWIKINGKELRQGDLFQDIRIIEIASEQTVMRYQGYLFSIRAMEDWQY